VTEGIILFRNRNGCDVGRKYWNRRMRCGRILEDRKEEREMEQQNGKEGKARFFVE
jgi:hypothetical protein